MPVTFSSADTSHATRWMVDAGVSCLITLGGDGTNRLVAGASGQVPLMPISTGTNNVFPTMVEGTLAGLAAGLVARGMADAAVQRVPFLEVHRADAPADIALVGIGETRGLIKEVARECAGRSEVRLRHKAGDGPQRRGGNALERARGNQNSNERRHAGPTGRFGKAIPNCIFAHGCYDSGYKAVAGQR